MTRPSTEIADAAQSLGSYGGYEESMNNPTKLIDSYVETLRELVNTKIDSTKEPVRESLRLSKDEDWDFLCASMDVIEDANLALEDFLEFGLDGPAKYERGGERYLRL